MGENLIIGGGVIGLTTALELLRRGEKVRLLEVREHEGLGTSFANGGLLTPSMSDPWNAPGVHKHLLEFLISSKSALKLRLGVLPSLIMWGPHFLLNSAAKRHEATTLANLSLSSYSLRVLEELQHAHALSFEGERVGSLKIFRSAESLDRAAELTKLLGGFGLRAEITSGERAVELEPALKPVGDRLSGAIHYPDDGAGDAFLFSRAVAKVVRALGGVLEFGRDVRSIEVRDGRAVGVRVGNELVSADRVIVATGVASPGLVSRLGLKLRIKPVKGYSVTYTPRASNRRPMMPVIDDAYHAAVTPLGNRLRVAGTAEFAGNDVRLDRKRIENLSRLIEGIYPDLFDRETLAAGKPWAGLRPVSADGRPYIGRGACPNLWLNTGHGHLGWTMAAGSARLLADMIEGKQCDIDPEPFRVGR